MVNFKIALPVDDIMFKMDSLMRILYDNTDH